MQISSAAQTALEQKLSGYFSNRPLQFIAVTGGSINQACRISDGRKNLFCKINSATKFPQLFAAEISGLQLIQQQHVVQTPAVIDSFEAAGQQFLILEWISQGEKTPGFWKSFGRQLAALHQISNDQFGWTTNNYMGSVPQSNTLMYNWSGFFAEQRLYPLIERCAQKKLLTTAHLQLFEKLVQRLVNIFDHHQKPALLHGDLWSGNFMCNQQSAAVLIDPAVYFGHPSVDLGMTTLFGGFHQAFYDAYQYHHPLPKNYKEQWQVCNLYPLLIHLLLFGRSYLKQIELILYNYQ